jgi:osmotically-inducible protein OsmY
MRDSEIEQWVLNEIRTMSDGRLRELCVLSINGVVNLRGTVRSRAKKHAAELAASRAKGVSAVISHLQVVPRISRKSPAIMKPQVAPAAIPQAAKVALTAQ